MNFVVNVMRMLRRFANSKL